MERTLRNLKDVRRSVKIGSRLIGRYVEWEEFEVVNIEEYENDDFEYEVRQYLPDLLHGCGASSEEVEEYENGGWKDEIPTGISESDVMLESDGVRYYIDRKTEKDLVGCTICE